VFGSATWAMHGMDLNRLGTWVRKILRKAHGLVGEQEMWIIRSNQELRELYRDLDIYADISQKRLEWTGTVVRMAQGRIFKKIIVIGL
jgi:hypothetical protein